MAYQVTNHFWKQRAHSDKWSIAINSLKSNVFCKTNVIRTSKWHSFILKKFPLVTLGPFQIFPRFFQVALVGSDTFVNQVLRPYVELFSSKPPDWQGFLKFFIIPLGVNTVSKHIGNHDPVYASLFLHESWKELLEMAEPGKVEVSQIVSRVTQYLTSSSNENLINLPVAEAMVTYKEKR